MNKNINVENTINAILQQEGQESGIKLIRDILNNIAKGMRRKKIRVNTFDSIASGIYFLMAKEGYSRARAIDRIEEERSITSSTINNHLRTFNKKAKEIDYMNFGYCAEGYAYKNYSGFGEFDDYIIMFGDKFNFSQKESLAYFFKFKIDEKKYIPDFDTKYSKY